MSDDKELVDFNLQKPDLEELAEDMPSDELCHYGTKRHSGRYPWGSGEDPYQHSGDFLSRIDALKESGMTEKEMADYFEMSTTEFRQAKSIALDERRRLEVARAKSLQKDGLNASEIGRIMGRNESTIRSLLNEDRESRMNKTVKTAETLKKLCDEKGMIDVGAQTERQLGISREKLGTALNILKGQGYEVYNARMPQLTNKGRTITVKALCPPGTPWKAVYSWDEIHPIVEYTSRDGGETLEPSFRYPESLDSKRVQIVYAEDGGAQRDGLIELRRGVKDISLGGSNYAQVRIMVDGTHYIKGMAVYSDDLPAGVDVRFNTNKSKSKPMLGFDADGKPSSDAGVLKAIKDDPENPFGSAIKENGGQLYYDDPNGKYTDPMTGHKQSLSVINKRADQGDWGEWSHELPSQFLSKQPLETIKKQLLLSKNDIQDEFDEIMSLTNPTIKKHMLESFADSCDAASMNLKAAAFPGQKYKVILPIPSLKDTEVYNPDLKDGTQVALVRFPHGGRFEIPILTVNNNNKESISRLGSTPSDAIGINAKVASILSGADFDGDTVIVVPLSNKVRVVNQNPLKGLEGFDPSYEYGYDETRVDDQGVTHYYRAGKEFKIMNNTQIQMGMISNLITDMTVQGAPDDELARAVRHSMVVIDAEKHKLDYRQSEIDNNIAELKKSYQTHTNIFTGRTSRGAATLLSQAKSPVSNLPEMKEGEFYRKDNNDPLKVIDEHDQIYIDEKTGEVFQGKRNVGTRYIDPETGKKLYHETNRTYIRVKAPLGKDGKLIKVNGYVKDGKYYYKDPTTKEYIQVTDPKNIFEVKATSDVHNLKMELVDDARQLSLGTPQEEIYAEYANMLKAMANKARKEILTIKGIPYSASARELYSEQVESLKEKVAQAELNAPRERRAQAIANSSVKAKEQDNYHLTPEQLKKLKQVELSRARAKVGAKRNAIVISEKEWEAIQAGAISSTMLTNIIKYVDDKRLKELAMPKHTTTLSPRKISRAKAMSQSGYTTAEIADTLGVSVSTISRYLSGKE